jgi:predicted Rossmann-fold nucleotide-binding protein
VFSNCRCGPISSSAGAAIRSRAIEYDYTKKVGYELGLRGLDVCTGCGPGAMKGPMKGATIGHSKQRIRTAATRPHRPGIIAAEPPNPIVSQLVIMPDIEKRLEAFVRLGHGIVIFPGGAGTAEEILYLLGILLDPANRDLPFPVVFTGPADSAEYFDQIHRFIGATLGAAAQSRYQIIIDDPAAVARAMVHGMPQVRDYRRQASDSYGFNWLLKIPLDFSCRSRSSRMRRCAACASPAISRCTNAPRTCGARFRESSRATSRSTASMRSSGSGPSSCRRALDHGAARRVAALLRRPGPHEAHRHRVLALLPARGLMNEPQRIRYRFDLPDGSQKYSRFQFDAADFACAMRRRPSRRFGRS